MASFSLMQVYLRADLGPSLRPYRAQPGPARGSRRLESFLQPFGLCLQPVVQHARAPGACPVSSSARTGAGIAGATISTAQAVIADCTTPEHRKHGMALIGAAFGIGFTFGPLIGSASLFISSDDTGAFSRWPRRRGSTGKARCRCSLPG